MAECAKGVYRPRRPRETAFYRLVEEHYECSHIPNRGEHLVRYYGYYSSVQRGRRRRQGREKLPLGPLPPSDDTAPAKAARANWARFIKKVFAADPLVCRIAGHITGSPGSRGVFS